jgi:hypothetical protein
MSSSPMELTQSRDIGLRLRLALVFNLDAEGITFFH